MVEWWENQLPAAVCARHLAASLSTTQPHADLLAHCIASF